MKNGPGSGQVHSKPTTMNRPESSSDERLAEAYQRWYDSNKNSEFTHSRAHTHTRRIMPHKCTHPTIGKYRKPDMGDGTGPLDLKCMVRVGVVVSESRAAGMVGMHRGLVQVRVEVGLGSGLGSDLRFWANEGMSVRIKMNPDGTFRAVWHGRASG